MSSLVFLVQGSAAEPYRVVFSRRGLNITAECDCAAADKRQLCKHRLRLLDGVVDDLASNNVADVAVLASWLPGSDIEQALLELQAAERNLDAAKQAVAVAKKQLERRMFD